MKHDVHVYPIFRVKVKDLQGTPDEIVAAAEFAVQGALNGGSPWPTPDGKLHLFVTGQAEAELYFADGFDTPLVDVMDGPRRVESFEVNPHRVVAQKHAFDLGEIIDEAPDTKLAKALAPIKLFLENI